MNMNVQMELICYAFPVKPKVLPSGLYSKLGIKFYLYHDMWNKFTIFEICDAKLFNSLNVAEDI